MGLLLYLLHKRLRTLQNYTNKARNVITKILKENDNIE